jgi:autotransporter-associated beta strand protein
MSIKSTSRTFLLQTVAIWRFAFALLVVLALSIRPVLAQTTFNWDLNGATTGAGTTPSGIWDTTTSNWNTTSTGSGATTTFVSGGNARFSAGTDATGSYTVTVSGTQNVSGITVQDGTPTFSGGTINFSDASPTLAINTGRTLNWGSTGLTSATNSISKSGAGILNFTQNLTFGGTVNLSGGTLRLSSTALTLNTLNITGNTTIDFAGTASTLSLTNLAISSGVTLTITNWTNATDYFFTSNWTGAVVDLRGAAPMNQVTFNGFAASSSEWQGYDHQITPVPEPAAYGAGLLGLLLCVTTVRRWKRSPAIRPPMPVE